MKVLLTGGTGFVGQTVLAALHAEGHRLRRALRRAAAPAPGVEDIVVGPVSPDTDWTAALRGVDAVVHLAARAHVLRDTAADPEREFMQTNAEGSRRLAEAAAAAGVGHLLFVSSIGVHGIGSGEGVLDAASPLAPVTPYGRSKAAAETALRQRAQSQGLRVTVLRPPLVYGPGAPGNLERLMAALARGLPLPLAAVRNQRSLVGVANLASAIAAVLASGGAGYEAYPVADRERLSTPELLRLLASGLGRPARLWPVPPRLLALAGRLTGRSQQIEQLCGSLVVDGTAFASRFRWQQPQAQPAGLLAMARAFAQSVADREASR